MRPSIFVVYFVCALALKRCAVYKRFLRFSKVRTCHKSALPPLSFKTVDNVLECMSFARNKNGLAFNFSPQTLRTARNCQVLGCPEIANSSTLVFDPLFDYYTAYGDFNSTVNGTCVSSVGLFVLVATKMNYSDAALYCQNLGGDLADVLGESRTNVLAPLLKSERNPNAYKSAYVGLDDMDSENVFTTAMGGFLECSKYRAWGVGHPRPRRQKEDCVILDTDKTWKAINCRIRQQFLCEFFPSLPAVSVNEYKYKNCSQITGRRNKRKCRRDNELFRLYSNSTRFDQCALMNALELK